MMAIAIPWVSTGGSTHAPRIRNPSPAITRKRVTPPPIRHRNQSPSHKRAVNIKQLSQITPEQMTHILSDLGQSGGIYKALFSAMKNDDSILLTIRSFLCKLKNYKATEETSNLILNLIKTNDLSFIIERPGTLFVIRTTKGARVSNRATAAVRIKLPIEEDYIKMITGGRPKSLKHKHQKMGRYQSGHWAIYIELRVCPIQTTIVSITTSNRDLIIEHIPLHIE
jgi:hypothetical protein